MIELTELQRQALQKGEAVRLALPELAKEVVVLAAETYEELCQQTGQKEKDEDNFAAEMAPYMWDVMKGDWDDPAMDVYDKSTEAQP